MSLFVICYCIYQVCKGDFINYCRKSEMFASLDKNKDKVVSDIEVTSKAHLAFKALDKNQDGFISKKEFSKISKNLTKEQVIIYSLRRLGKEEGFVIYQKST